ncbi:hypothetical protein [Haladaptatus sp. NG-SE-30]
MEPLFDSLAERDGVEIYDPIEKVRFELYTSRGDEPTPADTRPFYYPVDSAVTVETDKIVFPKLASVFVYSESGEFETEYNPNAEDVSLPGGVRFLELSSTPIKLYVAVDSTVSFSRDGTSVRITFEETTRIRIGARSYHEQPAGTITVTGSVEEAMRAVSTFGSALKTTSPERSYPTLRGQPPLIEVGDEFDVPDVIGPPDTGVRIGLPMTNEAVYSASSLAYYLGAEVVRGRNPRLVADGFEYSLEEDGTYEETINRVLRQVVFFDCLTRVDGLIQVDLYERAQVEPLVDIDFAALYDATLPEQLAAYLSVPFETIAKYVPQWSLTTDITPIPKNVEVLPFLAYDLSLVRSAPASPAKQAISQPELLGDFYRSGFSDESEPTPVSVGLTRGGDETPDEADIVRPNPVQTTEHAWVGDGYPLGANKLSIDALKRRFDYSAPNKPRIDVRVVCNDEAMEAEVVDELYGFRGLLEYDVTIEYDLTTDELRERFECSTDLLHYIGHVDEQGFQCSDGSLDARTLDEVAVTAFFLNACQSYDQGSALVEKGSIAGVVTLADVANDTATRVGRTFARLLNCGFPLRTALSLARRETVSGYQYITLGNGSQRLVQGENGSPHVTKLSPENSWKIRAYTYASPKYQIGSTFSPNAVNDNSRYLVPGESRAIEISSDELNKYLDIESHPVEVNGEMSWSTDIYLDSL